MIQSALFATRMYSSRIRTARLLTVSQHALRGECTCPVGVYVPRWVYLPGRGGGGPAQGVYLPSGVPAQVLPHCEQKDWQTGVKT